MIANPVTSCWSLKARTRRTMAACRLSRLKVCAQEFSLLGAKIFRTDDLKKAQQRPNHGKKAVARPDC